MEPPLTDLLARYSKAGFGPDMGGAGFKAYSGHLRASDRLKGTLGSLRV